MRNLPARTGLALVAAAVVALALASCVQSPTSIYDSTGTKWFPAAADTSKPVPEKEDTNLGAGTAPGKITGVGLNSPIPITSAGPDDDWIAVGDVDSKAAAVNPCAIISVAQWRAFVGEKSVQKIAMNDGEECGYLEKSDETRLLIGYYSASEYNQDPKQHWLQNQSNGKITELLHAGPAEGALPMWGVKVNNSYTNALQFELPSADLVFTFSTRNKKLTASHEQASALKWAYATVQRVEKANNQ